MKRRKSVFIFLLIVLLVAVASLLYRGGGFNGETAHSTVDSPVQSNQLDSGADYSLIEPHFVEMKGNERVMEVVSDSAYYYKDESRADLERPRMVFYGEGGRVTNIEGAHGIINTETNDLSLEKGVLVRSSDGHLLKSESLRYLSESKHVITSDPVTVVGGTFRIKGVGMKVDIEKETYRIDRAVEAFFNITGSEGGFDGAL